jgi:hypothetical protein
LIEKGKEGDIKLGSPVIACQRQKEPTHIDPISLLFLLQGPNALHEVRGVLVIIPNDTHALSEQNGHI